jgi:hypothetical protein
MLAGTQWRHRDETAAREDAWHIPPIQNSTCVLCDSSLLLFHNSQRFVHAYDGRPVALDVLLLA